MNFDESSRLYPERGHGKSFPETTSLEKTLIIVTAVLVVVGIGLTINMVNLKKTNRLLRTRLKGSSNESGVCFTPTCISEASNLIKSMDTSVDPCTDFYSFVCGNWIKNNYLVSSLESQFTKLTKTIILRVKEILEDLKKDKDLPQNKQKTVDFYKACMDKYTLLHTAKNFVQLYTTMLRQLTCHNHVEKHYHLPLCNLRRTVAHRNEQGAQELIEDLKKFGGWPLIQDDWKASKFDWAELMIQLFKNGYISNMLFLIKVDVDVKNTSTSLLTVSQPSLGLINRLFYILPQESLIKSYKNVLFKLAKLIQNNITYEESMEVIDEAFKIEDKIAHLMKDIDMKYPETYYNIMTLEQLQAFAPKIPWKKMITNLLPPNTTISDDEKIMVTSPTYIKGLNNILEKMDDEKRLKTLANYMFYRVVFNTANYLSRQYYSLVSELFEADTIGSPMPWEVCAKTTLQLFPLPLTATYVSRYTGNRTKEVLGMMVKDIQNSLENSIKNSDWLDTKTKDYALLKVQKMKAAIGYQDEIMNENNLDRYYENVNITDDHFGNIKRMIAFRSGQSMKGLHEKRERFRWFEVDNLLTANAYYRPAENTIIIPVGVLQDTVFAAGRPNYINYGSLGMIVGHELTHAFDSIGSLYDAEGSYRMWWSTENWKKFEEKMKCYEEQYNKYYVPVADANVNGTLTLGENVADNGGLKATYYAYKALLSRVGSEKSLPGLHYNEKQMFWISFASVWCRKQTDESIQYAMKHSVHTPSKFRVIGSLSNIEEFSEDFKCKLNTTMNPASKCSLWK